MRVLITVTTIRGQGQGLGSCVQKISEPFILPYKNQASASSESRKQEKKSKNLRSQKAPFFHIKTKPKKASFFHINIQTKPKKASFFHIKIKPKKDSFFK
jgi:hypothetical protein